jgi:ribosomal protein S18 acetylase RimI-like enzyme
VTAAELARIVTMQRWVEEATATRVEPWRFGSAVFTDDFPARYDSNFLRVEKPVGTATPGELAAEADRLQAHLSHREVIVEDVDAGARLAAGFRELGYVVERLAYMALRTESSDVPALPVREVSPQLLRPTLLAVNLAMDGMAPADAEMLADFRPVSAERAGARYFAVELDGVLASYCELYLHDGAAQVEDVNTLEAFRNRGAGRAVVLAAIAEARAAGADLVWLLADADDWPQHLYAKLGFERVGGAWQFTKMAPQHQRMQGAAASAP